jgi:hypothetical protein
MSTRHVSAQQDYPFIPTLSEADAAITAGILDVFFVIQGDADVSASASSTALAPDPGRAPTTHLISYNAGALTTEFVFEATNSSGQSWFITFDVPNQVGTASDLGSVSQSGSGDCTGVLIFSSADIIDAGSASCYLQVEPCRSQWYTEHIRSLSFINSPDCSLESDEEVIELALGGASSLAWVDGYNTSVSYSSDVLALAVGIGNGLGHTDEGLLSYTDLCEVEYGINSSSSYSASPVFTINGLVPVNGDIDVDTSAALGLQRSEGKLEILVR